MICNYTAGLRPYTEILIMISSLLSIGDWAETHIGQYA